MTNTASIAAARSAKAMVNEKTGCVFIIAGADMHFPLASANSVHLQDDVRLFDSVELANAFAAGLRGETVTDHGAQVADQPAPNANAANSKPVEGTASVKVRKPRKPKAEPAAA